MENFYQSYLRYKINKDIFKKPIFKEKLFGNDYFGVIKEKNFFGKNFRWFQLLGLEMPELSSNIQYIQDEILSLYYKYKQFNNIYFQFGIYNELDTFSKVELKDNNFISCIYNKRQMNDNFIENIFGLKKSSKYNMPLASVYIDLSKSEKEIYSDINKNAKSILKKSINKGLEFVYDLLDEDFETFYDIWINTGNVKGFKIIERDQYMNLLKYLYDSGYGKLFIAKKDGNVVGGSICVFLDDTIVYLYGATDRTYGNLGVGYFLKYNITLWAKENGFKYFDLLGVSSAGNPDFLRGVSSFKQAVGAYQIEYFGNFDLPLNYSLYQLYKVLT